MNHNDNNNNSNPSSRSSATRTKGNHHQRESHLAYYLAKAILEKQETRRFLSHSTAESMDFIGPLPISEGYDMLLIMTDRLINYIKIEPVHSTATVPQIADVVYRSWYR